MKSWLNSIDLTLELHAGYKSISLFAYYAHFDMLCIVNIVLSAT